MQTTISPTAKTLASLADRQGAGAWYARLATVTLFFNFLVIAIGVVVRATGSGDGCGSHWPTCDGEVIPVAPTVSKAIEFTHRVFSGLDGPLILALVAGAFLRFGKGHPIRKAAIASLLFTGVEAWIGKYLVQKGLVAHDVSPQRAVWLSIHLINTLFLLLSLTVTAWYARGGERLKLRGQGGVSLALLLAFVAMLALGVSGAITALGDTLFPATSHADFMHQAQYGKHFLQQLRVVHPLLAGSVGLYLILTAGLVAHLRPTAQTKKWAKGVGYLFLAQLLVGAVNVQLLAPVWMQVLHLVMADAVWVTVALLAVSALAVGVPQVEMGAGATALMEAAVDNTLGRPTLRDYVMLTKPRVISLLLFTTLAAMFIARDAAHPVTPLLFLMVAIGGYLSAGAANAINMVIDRDIDVRMKRTASRPTVTQKIPSRDALLFGLGLGCASFAILTVFANLLSAMLALAGLVYYVIIYTLYLKRRTWHNIVIGGAAGAFPPLVGWAAVTGDLKSWLAWYLFAIIFVWTPAHFWALALLIKDDYAEAGIPMLPVVMGDRVTVIQIALYALLTAVVSVLPLAQGLVGWGYIVSAGALNIALLVFCAQLCFRIDRPRASRLFHYSMVYLALLFLAMAVDNVVRVAG